VCSSDLRLVCEIALIDNGPGIPARLRETLFYPMVSGRAEGSGLGLSIAQSILHQHQGLIECDSRPGRTEFRLLIPLEALPADPAAHSQSAHPPEAPSISPLDSSSINPPEASSINPPEAL